MRTPSLIPSHHTTFPSVPPSLYLSSPGISHIQNLLPYLVSPSSFLCISRESIFVISHTTRNSLSPAFTRDPFLLKPTRPYFCLRKIYLNTLTLKCFLPFPKLPLSPSIVSLVKKKVISIHHLSHLLIKQHPLLYTLRNHFNNDCKYQW